MSLKPVRMKALCKVRISINIYLTGLGVKAERGLADWWNNYVAIS